MASPRAFTTIIRPPTAVDGTALALSNGLSVNFDVEGPSYLAGVSKIYVYPAGLKEATPITKARRLIELTIASIAGSTVTATVVDVPTGMTIAFGDVVDGFSPGDVQADIWVGIPVTSTKINAAVAAAFALYPSGAVVHIPGGQGNISPDSAATPVVALRNDNIEIECGPGTTFVPTAGAAQQTWFLVQPSTLASGGSAALTANANRYVNTVTIGGGVPAAWAAGDIIQLQQTEIAAGEADGLLTMKIKSKAATTVTFEDSLPTPFTTARTAVGIKLNTVDNVVLRGIRGNGSGNTHVDTTLIAAQNTQNFKAIDCAGPNYSGHTFQAQLGNYKMHLERIDGDRSGQVTPSARASIECTYVTHLTMIDCHADNSPGFGIMLWACAYPRTFSSRANGCHDRNIKNHNGWFGMHFGAQANGSQTQSGISATGPASYNERFIGCSAHGNYTSNFYVIDSADEVWAIDCSFKGTAVVGGTGVADITLGSNAGTVHIVNCDYDSIYDGTATSLIQASRSAPVGVIYAAAANKAISATASETSLLSSTFKGPGLVLPADFWAAPRHLRIRIVGSFSNNNTDTINIKVKAGSTVLATTTAVTPGSALSAVYFEITCDINVPADGVAANVLAIGKCAIRGAGFTDGYAPMVNAVAPQIDTTASQTLDVTGTYSSNNVANVMNATHALVEVLA